MKTAAIFSDDMVLQRGRCVRIFGTFESSDSADITVSVPELCVLARAVKSADGRWEALLPPMTARTGCTVEVVCGAQRISFTNVAVGEVWLAGGQSNMEFELQNDKNGAAALAECSGENVRFYYTPKVGTVCDELFRSEAASRWKLPSAENSGCWSAVGYYFARELSRKLGVTVGIIGCNWGGTSASAWVSRGDLEAIPELRPYIEDYENACRGKTEQQMSDEYDEYLGYHCAWEKRMQKCYAERPDIKWDEVIAICGENRYPGPMGCTNPMRPCGLYETMISRVRPYTAAGFIYYQGESDDHRPQAYYTLMSTLIRSWRREWRDDTLPFLLVQLPMFKYAEDPDRENWAMIRHAQMRVYQTVRNTGIAVALDCGEFNNIHPTDKLPVGQRLYMQAMSEVYGGMERSETLPPVFREFCRVDGGAVRLYFDNCSGFDVRGGLDGFEVKINGSFVPAQARTDGETILLTAPGEVTAVRYKWTNYAEVELFGANGLPVPPFTSETGLSAGQAFDATAIRTTDGRA